MTIVVVLPIDADAFVGGTDSEPDLSQKASRSAGKQVKVYLPKSVVSQLAALKKSEPLPEKYIYRERGSSFIPNFHITVPDLTSSTTRWEVGSQGGALGALFPRQIPGVQNMPAASAQKLPQAEAIPACLGFTITMGGMMLFGSVVSEGKDAPSVSFNVLAASGNTQQGQSEVVKTGSVVKVSLPNGTVVEIPPAFVKVMNKYLNVIASAG
jgi:hypothetical protein